MVKYLKRIGSEKKRQLALLYLVIGAVAIGFAPIFVRFLAPGFEGKGRDQGISG